MAYCDAKKLESYWFKWIVAKNTPSLELYRKQGILWTKVIGAITNDRGKVFSDPSHPIRWHYINIGRGIYCQSKGSDLVQIFTRSNGGKRNVKLPLEYTMREQIRNIGIGCQDLDKIEQKGYFKEIPVVESWHYMLRDISKICEGISKRFNLPSADDREELAQDALLQVTKKLSDSKLVYTPGRASVFNLLTTTIFRCMYSRLNKTKKQQQNVQKLVDGVASGAIHHNTRSLRSPIPHGAVQHVLTTR